MENIKREKDLMHISSTGGSGGAQSAASDSAAGSDLNAPLFPLCGWRHWGNKVVDDWEAVGWDATGGILCGPTSAGLFVHLREKLMKQHFGKTSVCDNQQLPLVHLLSFYIKVVSKQLEWKYPVYH